jgi:DHA1 family bicyclomycin/chloramphenicol resistance-like MFS transporter
LIVSLIALSVLSPMSIQIFVPALPFIVAEFGVSANVAQLTITLSLVITGIATLFFGPLSDRYGRRRVVLASLAVYAISSAICALSPDIETLVLMRNIQALGASSGVILARAIAVDRWGHNRSSTILSYLTMAMGLSTVLSPSLGGFLIDLFGWWAPFAFGVLTGVGLFAIAWIGIPETAARPEGSFDLASMLRGIRRLIATPLFRGYALASGLVVGTFFSFIAAAPYLVVDVLGKSATEYGLWFMLMPSGFITGSLISSQIAARLGKARMCLIGGSVSLVGALAFAVAMLTQSLSIPTMFLPAMCIGLGNGLLMPSAQAGALSVDARLVGTASGLAGFVMNLIAAGASQIVAFFADGTPRAVVAMVLLCAASGFASALWASRVERRAQSTP